MKEANREVLDQGSLPELLAGRARRSSDRRLAADVAIGVIGASALAVLRPPLWIPLVALAATLGAYGAWGILDRELLDANGARARLISSGRSIVAVLGAASAISFGLSLFFAMMGMWIS